MNMHYVKQRVTTTPLLVNSSFVIMIYYSINNAECEFFRGLEEENTLVSQVTIKLLERMLEIRT
jgi:hypothetical protein